jgi:hypothetical protein
MTAFVSRDLRQILSDPRDLVGTPWAVALALVSFQGSVVPPPLVRLSILTDYQHQPRFSPTQGVSLEYPMAGGSGDDKK